MVTAGRLTGSTIRFSDPRMGGTGLEIQDHFIPSKRINPATHQPYDLFAKRIFKPDAQGALLCVPGNWCNGNIYRGAFQGKDFKSVDHLDSYANYAASQGLDVWIYHGNLPRVWSRYVLNDKHHSEKRDRLPLNEVGFENSLALDFPAVLDYIQEATGLNQIGWRGFSAGGLKGYAYKATTMDPRIAALEANGSPVTFTDEQTSVMLMALVSFMYFDIGFKTINPFQLLSANILGLSRFAPHNPRTYDHFPLIWNGENIRQQQRFVVDKVSEPLPTAEFYFFVQQILTRRLQSLPEGSMDKLSLFHVLAEYGTHRGDWPHMKSLFQSHPHIDYLELMSRINCPVRITCGAVDAIAPQGAALPALDAISTPRHLREVEVVHNAGHVDLMLGDNSPEGWSRSVAFFKRHLHG